MRTNLNSNCQILPNFTKIATSTIQNLNLKTPQILKYRNKHFDNALNSRHYNLDYYQQILNNLYRQINYFSPLNTLKIFSIAKSRIALEQQFNDQIRNKKLHNLIFEKSPNYKPPIITIFNHTNVVLPLKIQQLLEHGLHSPIGGFNIKNCILTKFEDMFQAWRSHANNKKLDVFQINHVKSKFFLAFEAQSLSNSKIAQQTIQLINSKNF